MILNKIKEAMILKNIKTKTALKIVAATVAFCLGVTAGYLIQVYNHPKMELMKSTPVEYEEEKYIEHVFTAINPRRPFTTKPEKLTQSFADFTDEVMTNNVKYFKGNEYTVPYHITVDFTKEDGKTVVTFSGYITRASDNERVEVNDRYVTDLNFTWDD